MVMMEDGDKGRELAEKMLECEAKNKRGEPMLVRPALTKAETVTNVKKEGEPQLKADESVVTVKKEETRPAAVVAVKSKPGKAGRGAAAAAGSSGGLGSGSSGGPCALQPGPGALQPGLRCRFPQCSHLVFRPDSRREMKLHYAAQHFAGWFPVDAATGLPERFMPQPGNRALCEDCSVAADKPVYIQSEREAIRGHLVVKHDLLGAVLRQARNTVVEAEAVLGDLYPEPEFVSTEQSC